MKQVIHRRDVIRQVLDRYRKQYERYGDDEKVGWKSTLATVGDTKRNLAALDLDKCSVADVVRAMNGTTGWASLQCDGCGEDVAALLRIGDEPDYEARWQDLCVDCVTKAFYAIKDAVPLP